jgi:hypothetical protein
MQVSTEASILQLRVLEMRVLDTRVEEKPMYKTKLWLAAVVVALVTMLAGGRPAQAQEKTGSLHGHVQDPAGTPLAGAQVQVSTDGKTAKYTFTADQNGDYKGSGIEPGTYVVTLFQATAGGAVKPVDRFESVKITAGQDTLQDFDLSRPDFIKKLTPEQQKAIEDAKSKNAQINKENQNVKQLNGMLQEARGDITAKNYDQAATLMQVLEAEGIVVVVPAKGVYVTWAVHK